MADGSDTTRSLPPVQVAVERIDTALDYAKRYSQIDGAHHKAWVIDQMVRALTGRHYEQFVAEHNDGEDGPDTYGWDEGIAP